LAESKAELLSLQQIRCFCAAASTGSFTAAADALGVSQPAVAEQVRKLERALGSDLFARAGRGVLLTDAGHAFEEHAAQTLKALENATSSVGELSALRSGVLALGAFSAPSAYRFDELVSSFLHRHPAMTLRLVGRNSSLTADRVRRGELEAAVVLLPIDDERLAVRPLARDEVLYVSASPERTRRPATIAQLASTPLIFYDAESSDNDPIRRQLAERAQADGVRLRPRVEVELIEMALRLVADGLGDTYVPSAHTRMPYYPAGLHAVPFRPAMFDTFALITRRAARLSPAMRELVGEGERHLATVVEDLNRER
jgi:DNA-binding transcriptional LysR family regulator